MMPSSMVCASKEDTMQPDDIIHRIKLGNALDARDMDTKLRAAQGKSLVGGVRKNTKQSHVSGKPANALTATKNTQPGITSAPSASKSTNV